MIMLHTAHYVSIGIKLSDIMIAHKLTCNPVEKVSKCMAAEIKMSYRLMFIFCLKIQVAVLSAEGISSACKTPVPFGSRSCIIKNKMISD